MNVGPIETARGVTVLDPLAAPDWDQGLAGFANATPFHATPWLRTLSSAYGHRFYALRFASTTGESPCLLVLGLVRSPLLGSRLVALPFSDFAPPLGNFGHVADPVASQIMAASLDLARQLRCRYVELRAVPGISADTPVFRRYWAHTLDLQRSEETLWQGLAAPVRTALRRAQSAGVQVRILYSADAVAAYYKLHCLTRRSHGAPPQPWRFFAALAASVIEKKHGFVALGFAPGDDQPCAGAVFLVGQHRAVYKFGASNERGRLLRVNNLVMWQGIQHLVQTRCSDLHFGRTDLAQPGLRRFKLGWGASELPLHYYRLDVTSGAYQAGAGPGRASGAWLFRRLPAPLSRWLGGLVYPHLH